MTNKCIFKNINYDGVTVGCYEVLGYSHLKEFSNQSVHYWSVRCIRCDTIKTSTPYRIVNSSSEGCGSCVKGRFVSYKSGKWKNSDIHHVTGMYYQKTKHQAKKRKIEFDLTRLDMEEIFLKQNGKCAYTGYELSFPNNQQKGNASIDRIDAGLGYIKSNVQWVHKDVNRMKWDLTHDKFLEICKTITGYQDGKN